MGYLKLTRIPVKASRSLPRSIRSINSARQNRDGRDSSSRLRLLFAFGVQWPARSVTAAASFRRKDARVPSYPQAHLISGWEGSMPTAELTEVGLDGHRSTLTEVGLDGYRSSRSQIDVAHSWAPPLR